MDSRKRLLVLVNNHFDPIWRRCWERSFQFEGKSYVSYMELQDYYLSDNLKLAGSLPDYKFEAESSVVLRKYLERHPEKAADFACLAKEGRFAVSGAGDNILDSNMVLGESLVRNFLYGLLWAEDVLGVKCKLGVRNDAFGNSAQMPQIFRGCEIKWVTGFCYSDVLGDYFRGLDGSTVCCASLPVAGAAQGASKYPPCEKCGGTGCKICDGRGIGPARVTPPEKLSFNAPSEAYFINLCPEELLPDLEIEKWMKRIQAEGEASFAIGADAYPYVKDRVERTDNPPEGKLHRGVELNPNNTGCYVTRIKLKQECRRLEYAMLGAESLCCAASLKGAVYPSEALRGAWSSLLFTMFHDAITATHIDAAYDELMDMNAGIDGILKGLSSTALAQLAVADASCVTVVNPRGVEFNGLVELPVASGIHELPALYDEAGLALPVLGKIGGKSVRFLAKGVKAFSSKSFKLGKDEGKGVRTSQARTIESSRFKIDADFHGILSIYDKKLERIISEAGEYRPGEAIVESDEGSPWATLKNSVERSRATSCEFVAAEDGPGWRSLSFKIDFGSRNFAGGHPFLGTTKVTLVDGLDMVRFDVDAERWDAFNARLRFAFPLPFAGEDHYEIPYGQLKRYAYEPSYNWIGANGDWPAVNWAGVQGDGLSVALFNKGLPSNKIESDGKGGKLLLLSVLRSPVIPTYLHEPWEYVMTDFWGMRDAGRHSFEFALSSYAEPFAESGAVADAEAYNAGAFAIAGRASLPEMPALASRCARISSVKMAEKGKALIVRLHEFRGQGGDALLSIPGYVKSAAKVNMLERCGEALAVESGAKLRMALRPWEIATIRLELA